MKTNLDFNTSLHESQLIAAARAGETSGLVEYVYLCYLPIQAIHLVDGFRAAYGSRLEVEDVVQVGIEHVLRCLDKALVAHNPIAWLRRMARLRMLDYCQEYRSCIRVPASSQRQNLGRVPNIASLDATIVGTEDLTLLDLLAL